LIRICRYERHLIGGDADVAPLLIEILVGVDVDVSLERSYLALCGVALDDGSVVDGRGGSVAVDVVVGVELPDNDGDVVRVGGR